MGHGFEVHNAVNRDAFALHAARNAAAHMLPFETLAEHLQPLGNSAVYKAMLTAMAGKAASVSETMESLAAEMKKWTSELTKEISADDREDVSDIRSR